MNLEYKIIEKKYYNVKELLKTYFQISDRLLTKLKKNNRILLNNKPVHINTEISCGDIISIDLNFDEESENILPTPMPLNILYEDEAFLIVNKKPSLPVHPSILHFEDSLSNGVKFYFESIGLKRKIRPVNRLDKNTSGIVIFAKNEYIQECLIRQMKNNIFKKNYLAILVGNLNKLSGTIIAPISRKFGSIIEREINTNGDEAITHFKLVKNFHVNNQELALVNFTLETGRTHQIRLHSKHIGHPILGDTLYGTASPLISRQALHAYKVQFQHPVTKKQINIETDLPDDIKNIIPK